MVQGKLVKKDFFLPTKSANAERGKPPTNSSVQPYLQNYSVCTHAQEDFLGLDLSEKITGYSKLGNQINIRGNELMQGERIFSHN